MNDKQKLTVIIVSYNSFNDIISNLEYLNRQHASFPFEVLIIENGDYSAWTNADIKHDYVNVYNSKSNVGFSRANNLGVSICSADFILFLNPDTIVKEDFITPIISYMEKSSDTGACAPMLTYENGQYQSSTGFKMGVIYEFMEAFMLISIYRFFKSLKYKKKSQINVPVSVGWVSAACMIVKRSVFESVGGFTEEYFLNYEDIDLCGRLEAKGFTNYYFPYVKCIHLDHKSFIKNYDLFVYSRYKSRLIYAQCHYGMLVKYCVRLIHIFGLVIRLVLVNFLFSGLEKRSRTSGYIKSLKLYLGIITK